MTVGKRAGDREKAKFRPVFLLLAGGITFALVAWGYLVFAAIDFGASARHDNKTSAWFFLLIASAGAMLCLFLAFMLAVRFARAVGIGGPPPTPRAKRDPATPKGGKRAAR